MCSRKNQISSKVTPKICLRGPSGQVPGYSGKWSRCNSVSYCSAQQYPAWEDVHTESQDRAHRMAGTPRVFFQDLGAHWVWFYLQEAPQHRAFPKLKALKAAVRCTDNFTKVWPFPAQHAVIPAVCSTSKGACRAKIHCYQNWGACCFQRDHTLSRPCALLQSQQCLCLLALCQQGFTGVLLEQLHLLSSYKGFLNLQG